MNAPVRWPSPEADAMLGRAADAFVADVFGVRVQRVQERRVRLGVKPYRGKRRAQTGRHVAHRIAAVLALAPGDLSTPEVARAAGCSRRIALRMLVRLEESRRVRCITIGIGSVPSTWRAERAA